ncbi:hypothetical protein PAXRUDRAFT_20402 [Paxillus rubicundulus Ve08.2h10]|uniref:Uncharacterized protein n=1 Tax=Paxillus rubicundulus Ve08.2h10 TaxID=930991 RepID=A0A0D0CEG8_9AGAM|nr:hypothetical protein PAXRUDRAFT_20402 [Paxillus rubicundulus Ve08.2h10]
MNALKRSQAVNVRVPTSTLRPGGTTQNINNCSDFAQTCTDPYYTSSSFSHHHSQASIDAPSLPDIT